MNDSKKKFLEQQYDIQQFWQVNNTYKTKHTTGPVFSVDTPPPTVSGTLHIGHIFSYTQTDIIVRHKRMLGCSVFYPFGFDDNGLPTERYVEKERNITSHMVGRAEFIKICLDESNKAQQKFVSLWKTIGLSVDWNCSYSTISEEVQKISQQSFLDLYKKGFIYRKYEPALYCTACRTSVSQAELDDVEKETYFTHIPFLLDDGTEVIIATTRPELLGACVALFYNPDDLRYIHLKNREVTVPLYGHKVKILPDQLGKVLVDKGTGIVMCCTFGDATDVLWFKTYNLPYVQVIGLDGKMTKESKFLEGLSVLHAREKILELCKQENLIRYQSKIIHKVAIYERSKREIEYVMLRQWFVKILPYKKELLEIADCIRWFPEHMKQRYINWVENLNWDWCISRQRFYGIPFPVWYTNNDEIIIPDESELPLDPLIQKPQQFRGEFYGDTDVMDTWNTSALTPYIAKYLYKKHVGSVDNFIPMGMRPQAHDIIRTWAFVTVTKAFMTEEKIPWNDIVISGHVLSVGKEKISKSVGNAPTDPVKLLELYPADAIRYWTASAKLGVDTAFSEEQFKNGNRLITKITNAAIFVQQHMMYGELSTRKIVQPVNKWIISQIKNVFVAYKKYFEDYEPALALGIVERSFWGDFCDNYIEIIKYQLFNPSEFSFEEISEVKIVLYYVFYAYLELCAPYLIYTTEQLYHDLYLREKSNSIHTKNILDTQKLFETCQSEYSDFNCILEIISKVRKAKSTAQLSLKAPIDICIIECDEKDKIIIELQRKIIKGCCFIHEIQYRMINGFDADTLIKGNDVYYLYIKV
jgi:valyl-tRNA synthetase